MNNEIKTTIERLLKENTDLTHLYRHEIRSTKEANRKINELREKIVKLKGEIYGYKNRNGLPE